MIIEDDANDAALIQHAFENAGLRTGCLALTGQEAMDYLFGPDLDTDSLTHKLPSLIILDLKMPDVPGMEILRKIKEDKLTRRIPTIVLTGSPEEEDMARAYVLGANSFIPKEPGFTEKLESLIAYWFRAVTLPA